MMIEEITLYYWGGRHRLQIAYEARRAEWRGEYWEWVAWLAELRQLALGWRP